MTKAAFKPDRGRVRLGNEGSLYADEEPGLFAAADSMGGRRFFLSLCYVSEMAAALARFYHRSKRRGGDKS